MAPYRSNQGSTTPIVVGDRAIQAKKLASSLVTLGFEITIIQAIT